MKIAIIGSGIAAYQAATKIREIDKVCQIDIFSEEEVLPYRRVALSRMIANKLSDMQFFIKNEQFYKDSEISLHLSTPIVTIDNEKKQIVTKDNQKFKYNKLILATGAVVRVPKNIRKTKRVFFLRNFQDLEKIYSLEISSKDTISILGGGVLGLEIADSLCKLGAKVNVLEYAPYLLSNFLEQSASEQLQKELEKQENLKIFTNFEVVKQENTKDSIILHSKNHQQIASDYLLVSAGVKPNIKLAKSANIAVKHGIIVNEFMQTNIKNIFAAGDCVEFNSRTFGLYPIAQKMGEIAGVNALKLNKEFILIENNARPRLNVFGVKLI